MVPEVFIVTYFEIIFFIINILSFYFEINIFLSQRQHSFIGSET